MIITEIKPIATRDFLIEVAKGSIPKHSLIHKFGHNNTVGTSEEDLWDGGGIYSYLSSATILKVSSGNANDTSAGTGLRTIQLYGLDTNYNEINETIILNGQTSVNSVKQYLRIFRMTGRTAGNGGKNVGIVYAGTGAVTSGVPANIYNQISVGHNQTLMSLYTIANNKTGYLLQTQFSTDSQKKIDAYVYARPLNEVFQMKEHFHFFQNVMPITYLAIQSFAAKTDIALRANTAATTAGITGFMCILLVDD